jgi:hypothetical protein
VRRTITVAIGAILALMVLAVPVAYAQAGQPAGRHQQIRELGAAWWTWALEKPTSKNPQVGDYSGGPKCNGGGERGVWFLAGSLSGGKATRHCTMPVGRRLFFPIVNVFHADPKGTVNEEKYRRCVNRYMDLTLKGSTTFATIDGKRVSGQRADTPLFTFDLPKDNVFGAPSGAYIGVADGLWVLQHPLSKGEHTVHFGGSFPNAPTGGCIGGGAFKENITYKLKVVSKAH